jgi:hypothetical protein
MILLNLNMWKDLNESAKLIDNSHSLLQYTCIILTLVISVSGLIFSLVPYASAQNSNPPISPPDSHPQGLTYGQWAAKWWQWAYYST